MGVLTNDAYRSYKAMPRLVRDEIPAIGADIFYEGAAIGDNGSGLARPLVAADPFLGFMESRLDTTGLSSSDRDARIIAEGVAICVVVGVTGTADVGETVYASDDGTFTLTVGSNTAIGKITRHVSGTEVEVHFQGVQRRSL